MKGSEKLAVYVATFVFVIVGYLISLIVSDILADIISDMNIDFLTPGRTAFIVLAVAWFVITFLTSWGSTRWIEEGEKTGIMSLFFFILWIIASFAFVIAVIIKTLLDGDSALIDIDLIIDQFFIALPFALAPTIAVLLSVSNKSRVRD